LFDILNPFFLEENGISYPSTFVNLVVCEPKLTQFLEPIT